MIPVILREWRPRFLLVLVLVWVLWLLEPAFHTHLEEGAQAAAPDPEMGPLGISATLSYLAGVVMVVLLAGFVSTDRRRKYAHVYLSHPVSPLALYGLRWALAAAVALCVAALFLVVGQWIAWGEFRGGWSGLSLALLSTLVWGGLMAFLSTALPRGDAWVAAVLFVPTFVPDVLLYVERAINPAGHRLLLFLIPPQWAFQDVYIRLIQGTGTAWPAAAYVVGYALFWLGLGALLLRVREWA